MDNVKAANYNNANMETAHNDIRLATKIIGLVTARIQNLRKKKPNLQVTFCLLGDVLQNYVFDTFILRVDWNESGIPTKKIYLCLTPKKDFLNTENVTDSEADVNKILQISFSLFQQLQDISKHPLDKNLSQILKDVDPFDFSLILYTISDILLSLRVQVPPNNSPIIGTFETKKNGGFCLNAQHDVVKNAFTGSDHVLHCDFLSRTVWQDARIEAPDLNKLVKNSLQDYFWTLRDWPYGNITMEKYLRHIEELWRSRTILQNDSTKLHDIVSSLINAQHLVVPTDDLPASYMKQQFENHALSYVIVPDVPPILRCSRVKQVLERCCLKFLILCPEALKEWREDVLETICRSPALCEELVLSVVSVDNDLKKFLQRVRGSRCRVRVVTPIWKKETNDFLQTFHPSYSSWVDKWSNTERGRLPPLPLRRLAGGCGAHGALYETKMAALVALRARRRGLRFQLHVNVAAVRPWDDLVLRVEGPGPPATCLVQLKHAQDDGCLVSLQAFTRPGKGDYSISKYFQQFQEFYKKYGNREELADNDDWLLCSWKLEDLRYIIFTNKKVEQPPTPPQAASGLAFPFDELLQTGDAQNTFSFQDGDVVGKLYSDALYQQEFLPRLRVFGSQAHVHQLHALLVEEVQRVFSGRVRRAESYVQLYLGAMQRWMEGPGGHVVSHVSGELEAAVGDDLRGRARAAAGDGALAFQAEHCACLLRALTQPGGARLRVCVRGVRRGHRAAKALQLLDERFPERWMYVDEQAAGDLPPDALRAVAARCRAVVLDVDGAAPQVQEFVAAVAQDPQMTLVVLSSTSGGFPESLVCDNITEDWRLEHLIPEVQENMMDIELKFQGEAMTLRALERAWAGLRAEVDGPLLSALLAASVGGPAPALSVATPALNDAASHMARSLRHHALLRPAVLTALDPARHQLALSGFSREEVDGLRAQTAARGSTDLSPLFGDRWIRLEESCVTGRRQGLRVAFLQLSDTCGSRHLHWVERVGAAGEEGVLVWRATRGDPHAVAAFVQPLATGADCRVGAGAKTTCEHAAAEASAWEGRALLLLGEPGAGKSSFVARAAAEARRRQPARWHVVVPLLAHRQRLHHMPPAAGLTMSHVLELVAAAAGVVEDQASRRCLEAALLRSGAVTVYVDGVDEVVPAHKDKATRLLELFLQHTHPHARLWVASRPEVEATLGRVLCCAPLSLLPLERSQQLRFLSQQWASTLGVPCATVLPLAEELVDAVQRIRVAPFPERGLDGMLKAFVGIEEHSSDEEEEQQNANQNASRILGELFTQIQNSFVTQVTSRNSMLQTPLHLKMVEESFSQAASDALESGSNLLKEKFNQLEIFDRFIQLKRRHFEEKHGLTNVNSSARFTDFEDDIFKQFHQTFAMKIFSTFFPEADVPGLAKKLEKFKRCLPKEKTGILWQSEIGEPQFVHFSFIEFFVSTWLHDSLWGKHSESAKRLLQALLEADSGRAVLLFLDLRLCAGRRVHQAVLEGDEDDLQEALAQGEPADAPDAAGRSPLHLAAAYGRNWAVDKLLQAGANLEAHDELLGWTPLQFAQAAECLPTLEGLLAAGADHRHLCGKENALSLFTAIALDLPEVVHCFLQSRSSSASNIQLLGLATNNGSMKVIAKLFEVDPSIDVSFPCDWNGSTPLHDACCRGHTEVVKYLLSKNADPKVKNNAGVEPIHNAAMNGNKDIVDILVNAGADIESTDNDNCTPIIWATLGGSEKVVKNLLHRKANVHTRIRNGQQAIHTAATVGYTSIVEILLDSGADIQSVTDGNITPLHLTSIFGHEEPTKLLLSRGADVHARNSEGEQPIHCAATRGHTKIVEILLDAGADIDSLMNRDITPLHLASKCGQEEVTKLLLTRGANVHARSNGELQAIHLAANRGHTHIVEILLDEGADIESLDDKFTPLLHATGNGHEAATKLLLSRGADVHARAIKGHQAIHLAAISGHSQIIELLLDVGADIESVDGDKCTPVLRASESGHEEATKLLLKRGADVNARAIKGQQAIHMAAHDGHTHIVEILLDAGADINSVDDDKFTPLHAASGSGHEEVTKLLLKRGANVHASLIKGHQAIHLAVAAGHTKIIDILLDMGADIESVTDENVTPLHCASGSGHEEATKLLLKRGADVHSRAIKGHQAIHIAANGGHTHIVEILLDAAADINSVDDDKFTPLHAASESGHEEATKLLLKRGADVHARAIKGYQAIHSAVTAGHTKIIDILLDMGADIESVTDENVTPLHYASAHGHEKATKLLLTRGADVHARIGDGEQAIHFAVKGGNIRVLEALLRAGADIESVYDELSPLWLAVMMHIFKSGVADFGDSLESTAAMESSMSTDHMAVVEYLVRAGANPNMEAFMQGSEPREAWIAWATVATPLIRELLRRTSPGESRQ